MQQHQRHFWGRLTAIVLFWGIIAIPAYAIFSSILGELYGSPPALGLSVLDHDAHNWCVRRIVRLESELESRWRAESWKPQYDDAALRCVHKNDATIDKGFEQLQQAFVAIHDANNTLAMAHNETGSALWKTIMTLTESRE